MIQNRLNDKEKDIQGLKKQAASLLNCAWEKGYAAGFDDGYKTGREADELPTVEQYSRRQNETDEALRELSKNLVIFVDSCIEAFEKIGYAIANMDLPLKEERE